MRLAEGQRRHFRWWHWRFVSLPVFHHSFFGALSTFRDLSVRGCTFLSFQSFREIEIDSFFFGLISLTSFRMWQDYEAFLSVMFAEARRHIMDVQQIDVLIPDGMYSGQVLQVEYLGSQYEVMIPDGFGAGQLFQTTVTLPSWHFCTKDFGVEDLTHEEQRTKLNMCRDTACEILWTWRASETATMVLAGAFLALTAYGGFRWRQLAPSLFNRIHQSDCRNSFLRFLQPMSSCLRSNFQGREIGDVCCAPKKEAAAKDCYRKIKKGLAWFTHGTLTCWHGRLATCALVEMLRSLSTLGWIVNVSHNQGYSMISLHSIFHQSRTTINATKRFALPVHLHEWSFSVSFLTLPCWGYPR